jgi:hypothetical protein
MSVFALSEDKAKFETMKEKLLTEKNAMTKLAPVTETFMPILGKSLAPNKTKAKQKFMAIPLEKILLRIFVIEALVVVTVFVLVGFLSWWVFPTNGLIPWILPLFFILGLLASIYAYAGLRRAPFTWFLQSTCFYYSTSVADSLEHGKLVEASFYIDKLISFINPYAKTRKIQIETFTVGLKELFHEKIENLCDQKKAVVKAVRESGVLSGIFANHLYILAGSIFSAEDFDKNKANDSLCYLVELSQEHFQDTFLERHKTTNSNLKLTADVRELVFVLIPIIVPFILWLIFGYGK